MHRHRYILFAGSDYYPSGGVDDLVGGFETLGEAMAAGKKLIDDKVKVNNDYVDWWNVLETESLQKVAWHRE